MKSVEKAQCIVNVAKDQYNLCGMEGKPIAAMLLKALSALRLHRDHAPSDEMREAYRQVRQEEADTLAGKPFVLSRQLTQEEQQEILLWMQTPDKAKHLSRKDRRQIGWAVRFLKDYWWS
ncbi:MAG: hypothetical protein ACLRJV_18920 [Eubacteriales bacterium]